MNIADGDIILQQIEHQPALRPAFTMAHDNDIHCPLNDCIALIAVFIPRHLIAIPSEVRFDRRTCHFYILKYYTAFLLDTAL